MKQLFTLSCLKRSHVLDKLNYEQFLECFEQLYPFDLFGIYLCDQLHQRRLWQIVQNSFFAKGGLLMQKI